MSMYCVVQENFNSPFLLLVFTWASVEKPQSENAGHSSWASNGGS